MKVFAISLFFVLLSPLALSEEDPVALSEEDPVIEKVRSSTDEIIEIITDEIIEIITDEIIEIIQKNRKVFVDFKKVEIEYEQPIYNEKYTNSVSLNAKVIFTDKDGVVKKIKIGYKLRLHNEQLKIYDFTIGGLSFEEELMIQLNTSSST